MILFGSTYTSLQQLAILMYSLILKMTHSIKLKDAIAVGRGIYRVSEAAFARTPRSPSWMDSAAPIDSNQAHPQHINVQQARRSQKVSAERPQMKEEQPPAAQLPRAEAKLPAMNSNRKQQDNQGAKLKVIERLEKGGIPKQKQYLKQFAVREHQIGENPVAEVSAIPSSRLGRVFEFGKLGLSLASASIFSKGKDEGHLQQLAQRVSAQLCKMRGAPLKLAQMLSIQEDNLIPAPIRRAFEKARDSAHVLPTEEVELMLVKNLGQNWRKLFREFNMAPVASASIGQVHKGVLLSGEEVAVKIQYHQVKESIESDIQNLGLLLRLPGVFPKGMYMQRILKNTRQELVQECDYLLQKFYQQKYEYYLKESLGDEAILYKVPTIHPQLTTTQILTSQFLTGIKMKDLEDGGYPQKLRDQIGRRIMKLTFRELFEMGIMQSDPNPSNYTYNHVQDRLNLFDFGATHIYSKQFLQSYYKIIEGAVEQNPGQIWEASIKTGFVTGEQNMAMKNGHVESIMITGEPLRYEGDYDFGAQEITTRIYKTIPLMLKNRVRPPPEQVYSLHRKLSGSYLACIRLRARVNCHKIFKQISFKTLASHEKYEAPKADSLTNE